MYVCMCVFVSVSVSVCARNIFVCIRGFRVKENSVLYISSEAWIGRTDYLFFEINI